MSDLGKKTFTVFKTFYSKWGRNGATKSVNLVMLVMKYCLLYHMYSNRLL